MIAPIPEWDRLHPLVVHFPVALLLVAPFFVIIGAVLSPSKGRPFLSSALILMIMGTVSLFFAVATGDAAGKLAGSTAQVKQVLESHEELAETTCILFSALTVVFAHLLLLPAILKRELGRTLNTSLVAAFLILYGTGAVFLVKTAHQGGRMTHEFGIGSQVAASAEPVAPMNSSKSEEPTVNRPPSE